MARSWSRRSVVKPVRKHWIVALAEQSRRCVENLHTAWRRANEVFRTKFCEDTRDHFADRTDAVRKILLIHQSRQRTARFQARCRKVEEVARDALADRRKCISGKLLQDIVEAVNRFLRECPCQRRIVPRRALHAIDFEEERTAVRHCLHEDRRRSANQCRRTQQIAGSNARTGRTVICAERRSPLSSTPSRPFNTVLRSAT
jgi:hypothetical protein